MTSEQATLAPEESSSKGSEWRASLLLLQRSLRAAQGTLGRHLSVRWKLTLWYGIMCAATLGIVGSGMLAAFDLTTARSVDSSMHNTALRLLPKLGVAQSSAPGAFLTYPAYVQYVQRVLNQNSASISAPGQFEQVQMEDTRSIRSDLLHPAHRLRVAVDPIALSQVAATGHPTYVTAAEGPESLRVYLVPLNPPPELSRRGVVGVLEVFQAQHTYVEIRVALTRILLLGIPLGLLIALLAGWWIARAALRPIDRISRTVRRIGESGDLSRRLNFIGPSDEVGRLAETFDGMMTRLEKVFENQKRFVADASHELRTPLTAIRGNADLAAMAPPEEQEACIASIRREAERMSRLVADLLLMAEADVAEQPLDFQPVDLDELLLEVYRSAKVLAGDKVQLEFDPCEGVCIAGDSDRLKQLVLNLVDNAIKFTPVGGSVTLSLFAEPQGARIEVSDTGIGIPPEEQEAIFRRFYRVEESRTRRGSGLGLAISAWIVSMHKGHIEVRSEPGTGTTFEIWLPGRITSGSSSAASLRKRRIVGSPSAAKN